ncbi:hypothetical protein F5Y08DRAFT_350822 [Xylaria arbuscula]|uniref:Uncharacterized protein n=1 Tax=Xylaria arbuscula TaxID=114810 RepID=A0A9W8N3M6_9PEZI|nr:hypothetical protein F5Y08DRAFT_350822 [Xylaria arbuscula]KAJ3552705.1 hypothetical protein NPX13_g11051 [Xylaria arbuscula]
MAPSMNKADAPQSQVLFLNYGQPPIDVEAACKMTSAAIDSVLGMLGATPGFLDSLPLANKKAILYLASYAVDWRSCTQEYKDIAFCWSRVFREEKSKRVGVKRTLGGPIDYADYIRMKKIEPRIERLRQKSRELNRGIRDIAPVAVIPPTPVSEASEIPEAPEEAPPSDSGISGMYPISPPYTESEADSTAVSTVSSISNLSGERASNAAPNNPKTAPEPPKRESPARKESPKAKTEDEGDDISIDVNLEAGSEPAALTLDDMLRDDIDAEKEALMEPPASKKRKLGERDALSFSIAIQGSLSAASGSDSDKAWIGHLLQGKGTWEGKVMFEGK